MASHITKFIFQKEEENGVEMFSALTDTGSIRIGYAGGPIREFPKTHKAFCQIMNRSYSVAQTPSLPADEVEDILCGMMS